LKIVDTNTGNILKTYQKNDSPRSLIDNYCCPMKLFKLK